MEVEEKKKTTKMNTGSYYIRILFSVIFVAIMLVAVAYGASEGADWLVKRRSEQYQKYYGYLQKEEEVESEFIQAATDVLEKTVKLAGGVNAAQYSDSNQWAYLEQWVVTKNAYFKYYKYSYEELEEFWEYPDEKLEKYDAYSDINRNELFEEVPAVFCYDGKTASIKYADGEIKEYNVKANLESMNTAISKMATTYGYSDICVYVWITEENYEYLNPGLKFEKSLEPLDFEFLVIVFGIAVICMLMALLVSVRTAKGMMRKRQMITEIPIILLFIGIGSACGFIDVVWENFSGYHDTYKQLFVLAETATVFVIYFALRECVLKLKERRFVKDFLIFRVTFWMGKKCKDTMALALKKSNYYKFSLTKKIWIRKIIFMIFSAVYLVFAYLLCYGNASGFIFAILVYLILFFVFQVREYVLLKRMNEVYEQIDDIYQGNYAIRDVEKKDVLYDVTNKLNSLSNGMEEAVEKRISSEKMKVELITNVSHDLKTPLTSIISYVDLLKEEEMTETAAAYVKILEDKSYQLKNIVSDVFDIAKANSGQDIEIENIDGIMLIHQVLADMNDVIERSGKILKTDIQPDTFFIKGDGKKLYRALQNLIDNALKYSMNNTRIFVSSEVKDGKLYLTMKNIASYEMEFSGEDIVERFVRGDESRTTEGNGLGLSIAKSFIEVSGGSMNIEVDGDVFIVTVVF